jgi:hypothetical protein
VNGAPGGDSVAGATYGPTLTAALSGDEDAFVRLTSPHRRSLHLFDRLGLPRVLPADRAR